MNAPIAKTLLILANSIKKYPNRCVAGIELVGEPGHWTYGGWIRPIDPSQPEGSLLSGTASVNGQPVAPFQVIRICFAGPANDPTHPEDWIVDTTIAWELVGRYQHGVLFPTLRDETEDLWGRDSAHYRRVETGTTTRTLRLIKPKGRVYAISFFEYHSKSHTNRFKQRLFVEADGAEHEFDITDPSFQARHQFDLENGPKLILFDPENLLIVASLTPPFGGFQYKIAAAILEP